MSHLRSGSFVLILLSMYMLFFPVMSLFMLGVDLDFLLGNDQKTDECSKIFPYIWLFVFGNACAICACLIIVYALACESDGIRWNSTNNGIIVNQIRQDICKKRWECVIFITIVQMLLFVAYVCVYQIIESACNMNVPWTNLFYNSHNLMRFLYPCIFVMFVPLLLGVMCGE